ncbi:methyl-CpG-binding domain protein 1 [Platysternon megacephalum]|uniref:Methyl-CpG-binding domain protein 1 n=1 Tax=Platysternon megacephalum TaxID=55544 RepID=A0A4D9DWA2_9SAUR|nr:methyl-CpG-binding domain protein 1 [Platysternon megacephalum]
MPEMFVFHVADSEALSVGELGREKLQFDPARLFTHISLHMKYVCRIVMLVKGAGSAAPGIEILYPQDRHCEAARDLPFPFTGTLFSLHYPLDDEGMREQNRIGVGRQPEFEMR